MVANIKTNGEPPVNVGRPLATARCWRSMWTGNRSSVKACPTRTTVEGEPGPSYVIEATEDFSDWQPLVALTNESGTVLFQDSTAGHERRFYRARFGN